MFFKILSENLYTTIGCHPTRCGEFEKSGDPDKYMADLLSIATQYRDKIVAYGECGLGKSSLLKPMEFSIKFDTVKSGWSIIYIEVSQVIISKKYCISYS